MTRRTSASADSTEPGAEPHHAVAIRPEQTAISTAASSGEWVTAADRPAPWIAIVDARPCRREFVLNFLRSQKQLSEEFIALSIEALLEDYGQDDRCGHLSLIVCSIGGLSVADPRFKHDFERLIAAFPEVPLVVLSDLDDAEEVRLALAAGARGFVPTLLDPQLMCAALRLVRAGGKFAPPELIDRWMQRQPDGHGIADDPAAASEPDAASPCGDLTPRQTHVLHLLQQGFPNKIIATELGMTESTVKVHVRQIMRRLGARNRTEAALLAQRHLRAVSGTVC